MTRPSFGAARARYVHRYTMEHQPTWAISPANNGKFYAPQFRTDREWYDNTVFPGEADHFGSRNECNTSNETWPLGQWLNAPFNPRAV